MQLKFPQILRGALRRAPPRSEIAVPDRPPRNISSREEFDDWVDDLCAGGMLSREPVTPGQAMLISTVFACIRVITAHLVQCPMRVYMLSQVEGRAVTAPALPELERMLNREPDPLFGGPHMLEYQTATMLLFGDSYSKVRRGMNGEVLGLHPVHPSRVKVARSSDGRLIYGIMERDGMMEYVDQSDMVVWRGPLSDGVRGVSTTTEAGEAVVNLALALAQSAIDYFQRGTMQRLLLRRKGDWDKDLAAKFAESWKANYGTGLDGRNTPIVIGPEWEQPYNMMTNPSDTQLLESRRESAIEIARVFGVPGILCGIENVQSGWGTGVEVVTHNFLRMTLMPIIVRFENELTRKLTPREGGYEIRLETSALLRGSSRDRATYYRAGLGGGVGDGWLSINEVRDMENLPRIDKPEYDEPYKSHGATPGEALDEALNGGGGDEREAVGGGE